jgi:hypothetical protein
VAQIAKVLRWPFTVGAVVFLVLMIVEFVSQAESKGTAQKYGHFQIPGSGVMYLPKGTADIYFDQFIQGRVTSVYSPALSVGVDPVNKSFGYPPVTNDNGSSTSSNGDTWAQIMKVAVVHPGDYDVHASGSVSGFINAELLVGGSSSSEGLALISLALFIVCLFGSIIAWPLSFRGRSG